jgi:hypothetical protein
MVITELESSKDLLQCLKRQHDMTELQKTVPRPTGVQQGCSKKIELIEGSPKIFGVLKITNVQAFLMLRELLNRGTGFLNVCHMLWLLPPPPPLFSHQKARLVTTGRLTTCSWERGEGVGEKRERQRESRALYKSFNTL